MGEVSYLSSCAEEGALKFVTIVPSIRFINGSWEYIK